MRERAAGREMEIHKRGLLEQSLGGLKDEGSSHQDRVQRLGFSVKSKVTKRKWKVKSGLDHE